MQLEGHRIQKIVYWPHTIVFTSQQWEIKYEF